MKKKSLYVIVGIAALASLSESTAWAASETWQGGTGNWNSTNWGPTGGPSGSAAPGATTGTTNADTATFNTTPGTITVDARRNVKSITFDTAAGSDTLSGGPLILSSGGTISIASTLTGTGNTETISAPIALEGSYTFSNANTTASNTLVVSGSILNATNGNITLTLGGANTGANTISGLIGNGGATIGVTTSGTGKWILSSANTYAGSTSVGSGTTLELNNANAAQNSIVGVSQANGLTFGSGIGTFNLAGLGSGSVGEALTDLSGSAVTLQLGLYENVGAGTFSGVLSGSGSITKLGTGTQTFAGNNTYTGTTTIKGLAGDTLASTLAANGTPFGTGSVVINGGTLSLQSGTGAISQTIASGTGSSLTYGGGSTIALNKNGGTSLTLTIGDSAASGTTNVLNRSGNGVLILKTSSTDLSTGENVFVTGAAPTLNGTNGMASATIVGLGSTTANLGDFLTYTNGAGFAADTAGYTNHAASFTSTAGEIANVTAAATMTDSGGNAEALRVTGGALTLGNVVTIGDGTNPAGVILNGQSISGGGVLNFGSSEGIIYDFSGGTSVQSAVTGTGGVTISGNQSFNFGPGNAEGSNFTGGLNLEGVTYTVSGNNGGTVGLAADNTQFGAPTNVITLNGASLNANNMFLMASRSVVLGADGGAITGNGVFNFNISGSGSLTYAFGGNGNAYYLDTGINTYTGGTYINQGMVGISTESQLGGSSAALIFAGNSNNVAGLSIMGTSLTSLSNPITFDANEGGGYGFDIQSKANTFTLSQNLNFGTSGLQKFGAGTLVLTGAETYTGTTTVWGGTLKVDASQGGSLSSFTNLQLNGGTIDFIGSGGTTVQNVGNVGLGVKTNGSGMSVGGAIIVDNNSGNETLNLGNLPVSGAAITPGTALLLSEVGAGTSTITTMTASDGTGIYGGRVVISTAAGIDWASSSSGSSPYTITNYAAYTDFNGFNPDNGTISNDNSLISVNFDPADANVVLTGTTGVNTLKIDSGSTLDLAGFSLTMSAGGLLFTGANNYTILNSGSAGTITSGLISATETSTIGNAADLIIQQYGTGTLTISAVISNPTIAAGVNGQPASLTKAGPGTLVLTAANTYNGPTFLDGGVLSISSDTNIGGAAGTVSNVTSSTSLTTATVAGSLPGGFGIGSAFLGRTVTGISLSGSTYTVTLSGTAGTTLTGGVASYATDALLILNGGTLRVTSSMTMQQSSTGGTAGTSTATRQIQLGSSGGTIDVVNGSVLTYDQNIASYQGGSGGYAGLTIDSDDGSNGRVFLNSNSGASFVGPITINGGILEPGFAGSLTSNNNAQDALNFGSGSEINPTTGLTVNTTPTLALDNNQSFSSLNSPSTTTAMVRNNGSGTDYLLIDDAGSDSYSGVLDNFSTGNMGITKGGSGTLNLTNSNSTYRGITTIDSGVLNVASISNGGTSALSITTNSTSTSATLSSTTGLVSGTVYAVDSANVAAGTTFTYNGTTAITLSTAATGTGTTTSATIGVTSAMGIATNAAGNIVFGGATPGSAVLQYTGTTGPVSTDRLFTLGEASDSNGRSGANGNVSGANGTLDSSSTVAADTLNFTNTGSIAFVTGYAHSLTLTGSNTGLNTLAPLLSDPATVTPTLTGGAAGADTITVSSATGLSLDQFVSGTGIGAGAQIVGINGTTLTLSANNTAAVSGAGSFTGLATSLDKTGTGTWQVTNANTYSGGTSITGGTLYADNTTGSATGAGTVNVATGGTLGGTGFIASTINSGSAVSLGNGTIGTGGIIAPGGVQPLPSPTAVANGNLTLDPTNVSGSAALLSASASTNSTSPSLVFALGSGNATSGSKLIVAGSAANVINFNVHVGGGSTSTVITINDLVGGGLTLNQNYVLIQGNGNTVFEDNGQLLQIGNADGLVAANGLILGGLQLLAPNTPGNFFSNWYSGSELFLVGNDIEVEVIPEPSTWAMMIGGFALLIFLQRRKRKQA